MLFYRRIDTLLVSTPIVIVQNYIK